MNSTARRASYVYLCLVPFLDMAFVVPRALRVSGVYQSIGVVLFAAIVAAVWLLALRTIKAGNGDRLRLAVAGGLLLVPYALVSLLWVGLSTPWEATAPENLMRYVVLLVASVAVAGGFVALTVALSEAGERFYSTLGFAATVLAGPAYLVWTAFAVGGYLAKVTSGSMPAALHSLEGGLDVLLDAACMLTYLATAAFAASLGRAGFLGRGATRAYVALNLIALVFLVASFALLLLINLLALRRWTLRPSG